MRAALARRDFRRVLTRGMKRPRLSRPLGVARLLVLYVGENDGVLKALSSALGPQFAGK